MAKKANKQRKVTYIALVVDRSGSMGSLQEQAIATINDQLRTIRENSKEAGEVYVSMIQFDDQYQVDFSNKLATELKEEYNTSNYIPRGSTAMRDAVYKSIQVLKEASVDVQCEDVAYLIITISDGQENASREISASTLSEEIKKLQDTGKWTFTYMLSNQDLSQIRDTYNLYAGNVASFTSNAKGLRAASATMDSAMVGYMTSRNVGETTSNSFYSAVGGNTTDMTLNKEDVINLVNKTKTGE